MSYLNIDPCVGIQESKELVEFINSVVLNSAPAPELERANGIKRLNSKNATNEQKIEAAKTLASICTKLLIGHFITLFIDTKLSEFAVRTIRKNQRNKPLFAFIKKEINKVYLDHPDYNPCSAKQFEKTSIFNYFMSEWRDKTAKEKAETFMYDTIDNAITVIVKKSIPIPGSTLLAIPIKMMLTYCGCNIGLGSVYNIALEIDGETIAFGINYRPIGFTLSNLILYTFKGEKLIGTRLKNPPESLYKITVDDAKEILRKYGNDDDLSKIKKEVKRINGK